MTKLARIHKDRPQGQITAFVHCRKCLNELPGGITPREWADLEVGFTPKGLQVWCRRHRASVVHIDFEGARHPADQTIYGDFKPHPIVKESK